MENGVCASCDNPQKRRKITFKSFESIAQISVGDGTEKLLFHKSLLCDLAPFFKAALEGQFKEAAEAMINMPEETLAVVQRFHVWAYTGSPLLDDESIKDAPDEVFIRLYIFAERYDLAELQNAAIDIFVGKMQAKSWTPLEHLHLIYDNTSSTSPLRRLMVNRSAQQSRLDLWFAKDYPDPATYPHTFLMDLALEQYHLDRGSIDRAPWDKLGCTFHVHPATATKE